MNKRFFTGLIIGFAALFTVLAGGLWLTAAIACLVVLLAREYTEILKHKGFLPSFKIIIASSVLFGIIAYFKLFEYTLIAIILTVLMSLMWVLFKGKQPYIANVATTIFGALYCGWFPLHFVLLRTLGDNSDNAMFSYPMGVNICVILLFAVLVTDTFCYFAGCKFGKHKLSPVISPNKTIEGSIGGTVMCLIFAIAMGVLLGLTLCQATMLGILIAGFAQIGDLCESMIKRDAGVKDSSNILPGHGGIMDRTDSYLLTVVVVYYYMQYFVITNSLGDLFRGLF